MIAIYARVSTEEQAKNGFSLQDQLRACREKAKTDDVVEYVDEGVSGEFLDRPQLTRLRQDIQSGAIHQVICLDPDRLSRKLMNQLILSDEIESRADLLFVNGEYARTPEGQLFYQMRGAISQFEKAKITERMSRGRREKARQGRILRDFQIYGYDFDSNTEQFVINAREAAIVQLVFDLFTKPNEWVHGINGIARHLTDLGIPTKRGVGVFHRQVVRQMLMNRAYIGEFYQNKWNTEGMLGNRYKPPEDRVKQKHRPKDEWIRLPIPAIVDTTQFELAQELLEASRRRFAKQSQYPYLLGGLLRCGMCGNTLTGKKVTSWGREVRVYSDKKSTVGAKNSGCGLQISCSKLDDAVWNGILSFVQEVDSTMIAEIEQIPAESTEMVELRHIDEEQSRLDTMYTRLLDLLAEPSIDTNDIRVRLRGIQAKKRHLQETRASLTERVAQMQYGHDSDMNSQSNIMGKIQQILAKFNQPSLSDPIRRAKKELVRTVVKEIKVFDHGERIEITTL